MTYLGHLQKTRVAPVIFAQMSDRLTKVFVAPQIQSGLAHVFRGAKLVLVTQHEDRPVVTQAAQGAESVRQAGLARFVDNAQVD